MAGTPFSVVIEGINVRSGNIDAKPRSKGR
jgi:hypothetical protein